MNDLKRQGKVLLKLTLKESNIFDQLMYKLKKECNISKQRQSEIIFEGFRQYAEKLINSKNIYTQTNQQLNNKNIKIDAIVQIKEYINKRPRKFKTVFDYFFKTFAEQFGSCRTRFSWLNHLFESKEFVVLNLKSFLGDYYIIPRHSYFHAQFKDYCFEFPFERLNYQPTAENPARKKIYNMLNMTYYSPESLDKVEQFALKALKAHLDFEEKPMITDLTIREVLDLRGKWKHHEAQEVLKQEKLHKQALKLQNDEGMQLINQLGGIKQ